MPPNDPLAYLTEPYRRARDFTGRHILPTLDAASQLNPLTHLANRLRAPAGQALQMGGAALAPAMSNLPAIGPTGPLAAAGQAMAPMPTPAPSAAPAAPQAAAGPSPAPLAVPAPGSRGLTSQEGGDLVPGTTLTAPATGAVSSSVRTPPPGRGAGEYQYGDLTEGGESATTSPAEGGAPAIGPDTDLAGAQRALQEYYSGVIGTGPGERRAAEMRRIAGSMRGRSTGKLDWGSQLSDAIRGGVEGYTTYRGLKEDKTREDKLEELRQKFLAARMRGGGGAEQLSGPGME